MQLSAFRPLLRLLCAVVLSCAGIASAGRVQAQALTGRILRLHHRAVQCVDANDLQALMAFSDSVSALRGAEEDVRLYARVLRGMVLRKQGQATAAYHVLDSMALDPARNDYVLHFAAADQRARVLKELKLYGEAITEGQRALQFTRAYGLQEEEARALLLLAEIMTHQSKWDESLQALIDAEHIAERIGSDHVRCIVEVDLGNLFYDQERTDEAMKHYAAARDLARDQGMPGVYSTALYNLGAGTFDRSKDAAGARAAIAIFDGELAHAGNDPGLVADIHTNSALMYLKLGDRAHALERMQRSMAIRTAQGDTSGLVDDSYYLASILWDMDLRDSALAVLRRCTDLALRTGDLSRVAEGQLKASNYLKAMGRTAEAMHDLELYTATNDSLLAIAREDRFANLEIKYGTAKKEQALKVQRLELGQVHAAKRRREVQLLWSVGAALMLATVLLLLFRNNQHIKRLREKERVVHVQEVNDLMHQQEIRSLDAMMEGQERERKRIAQDLHDRLGSMLSAIKLQFSALEGRLEELRSDQQKQYHHVFTLLDDAVGEVRRISHDMVKSSLARFGLKGALEDLYSTVHVPGKLDIEMSLFGLDDRLDQRVEIAVYRMVQECISNALRHARAHRLTIQVTRSAGMLNLIVEDDGVGFDPTQVNEGMGMANLRRRAADVGGTVRVDTRPGRGTSISVDIPLA